MSPEDHADYMRTMAPVRLLVKASVGIIVACFVFPLAGLLLPFSIGIILPLTGYLCYMANRPRIAAGKTSFVVRTRGFVGYADHNHKLNQSANLFYMGVGTAMFVLIFATIISCW
jgi:hypothetical protein